MEYYQYFQHAEEYVNWLLAGMIVLSCYWFLISRRRRVLADFTSDGRTFHVYKLDNSIAGGGLADVRLKGSTGKPNRGYLRAAVRRGRPAGWTLTVKGNNPQNLQDGQSYGIFGRLFVFHSYLGAHKPYRGHFIPIILITAFSLIVQLYFSVYASFNYANVDPRYSFNLTLLLSLPAPVNPQSLLNLVREVGIGMGPFLGLFALEALLLVITSIANSRRLTPEVIFFFFLTYLGYLLYPGRDALILAASWWVAWCVVPPLLKRPFSWADMQIKSAVKGVLGVVLTIIAAISILWASLYVDRDNLSGAQIYQIKVYAAAGGYDGLGLYNGLFRFIGAYNGPDFVLGALFEELGIIAGALCVCMIFLTAFGCYFEGLRAERYGPALICFLTAGVIGLRAMFSIASSTGMFAADVMGMRLTLPSIGATTPFLTLSRASVIMLGVGMILTETVKLSHRIKPAAVTILESETEESVSAPMPVVAAESESGE